MAGLLTAQPVSSSTLPTSARWTGWAGSPELIAHIARTAERAVGESHATPADRLSTAAEVRKVSFLAIASVDRDVEPFDSPEAILRDITPEAMRQCQQLLLDVRGDDLQAQVDFRFASPHSGVSLTVRSATSDGDGEAIAAAMISMAIQRGFRRYTGTTEFSEGLEAEHVGTRSRLAGLFGWLTPFALGVATGLSLSAFLDVFFPEEEIPANVTSGITVVLGLAYPLWLRYAIPNVELAFEGKTRLRRTATRALLGLIALTLTTTARTLIGAE